MTRRRNLSSTVWREESNQVGNQVEQKSNEVEEESNQVEEKVTKSKTLTLDLDTFAEDHNTGLRHQP